LASKEGFLTKQGWYVKNWKTRWFVLTKNELSYYADRTVSVFHNVHEIETLLVIDMPERLSKDSVSSQRILPSFRRLRVCYSSLKYACNNYII